MILRLEKLDQHIKQGEVAINSLLRATTRIGELDETIVVKPHKPTNLNPIGEVDVTIKVAHVANNQVLKKDEKLRLRIDEDDLTPAIQKFFDGKYVN